MMKLTAFLLSALMALGASPAAAQAQAPATGAAKPLPVEAFFRNPAVRSPFLSPSGEKIAMLVPTREGRIGLAVADVRAPEKFVGVAQFNDADIRSFQWVNEQRLVFDAIDLQAAAGDQWGSGLYAVNADGSDFIWLIARAGAYTTGGVVTKPNALREPLSNRYQWVGTPKDGSDDVLVQRWSSDGPGKPSTQVLYRLDTRERSVRRLYNDPVPDGAQDWVLDPARQPRAATAFDGKQTVTVYWRDEGSREWQSLASFNAFNPGPQGFRPVAVDRDGRLYVSAINPDSPDQTSALYRYDVKNRKLDGKPLLALPGFDFDGRMHFDPRTGQLLGIEYLQDGPGMAWFDKALNEDQQHIDKQLPHTINALSCGRCQGGRHLIVTASSDIQSPVYFLYDRESKALKLLGATRPWLDSRALAGRMDFVRIKARDGLEIPSYVTKPGGKGPWPTVVLVHGGPNVRGVQWGFNPLVQFLASRGYLVVEPEFRGSEGYGDKLNRAGWKRWGLEMQDDVTDVTRWAIAQGLADAKRIALTGASYGGYATMMGLAKEPELYKVGVNWVGVTDIPLMYSIGWSDFLDADNPWARYGMPLKIGDPSADAEQFKATSPLQQAHRIKQPVLMAYGEEDYRVPLPHGTKMRDALIASGNKNVEWVQYPNEGHNFLLESTRIDFYSRFERFLAKHLN